MKVVELAKTFLGYPYRWGGSNPLQGFDCSGLVMEVYKMLGLQAHGNDMNAQGLFNWASVGGKAGDKGPGALVFFGKSKQQITHVGIMIDEKLMIEAGGGDSKTTNRAMAEAQGAWVRIRPMSYRKDFVEVVMPKYPDWVKE